MLEERVYPPEEFVPRLVREKPIQPSPPAVVVRREAYASAGRGSTRTSSSSTSRCGCGSRCGSPTGYVRAHDAFYRMHGSSLTARSEWGESWLRYQEHVERLLERDFPAAAFTPAESRARRASAFLSSGLDAVAGALGERRSAASARRSGPIADSLVDPRLPLTLLTLPFGSRGGRWLQRLRSAVVRSGIRLPFLRPH